jgi:hypothetical protein
LALLSLLALITIFLTMASYAQDATNSVPISPETATAAAGILGGVLAALAGKYGVVLTVVAWIGVLRTVFKPIMLVVEQIVAATPGKADDAAIAKFESGPVYRWLVWGLDWLASIKLTPTAGTNPLTK